MDLNVVLVDLALAGRHAVLALPAGFLLARLIERMLMIIMWLWKNAS